MNSRSKSSCLSKKICRILHRGVELELYPGWKSRLVSVFICAINFSNSCDFHFDFESIFLILFKIKNWYTTYCIFSIQDSWYTVFDHSLFNDLWELTPFNKGLYWWPFVDSVKKTQKNMQPFKKTPPRRRMTFPAAVYFNTFSFYRTSIMFHHWELSRDQSRSTIFILLTRT